MSLDLSPATAARRRAVVRALFAQLDDDGWATAADVGQYLGISTASAGARLSHAAHAGLVEVNGSRPLTRYAPTEHEEEA